MKPRISKNTRHRLKKAAFISLGLGACLFVLAILFISSLAKYLLEKYDQDIFGRELTMQKAYVNPLTGFVKLYDVKLFEAKGDSIFLSAKEVHGSIDRLELLRRHIEISKLTLEQPVGRVIQDKKVMNMDDLIERFRPKSDSIRSTWRVDMPNLKVVNGEFRYIEKVIPINYFIKKVNLESLGVVNQGDSVSAVFSFLAGIGSGDVHGNFSINTKSGAYRYDIKVHDFDLEIIRQYIWELINYGMFTAHVDAEMKGKGDFSSREHIGAKGRLAIRDFHLGKTKTDDYAAFRKLVFVIDEFNPAKGRYVFDSVLLKRPYIKYERYDSLDNIGTLFGKAGKNISDITLQPGRFNLVIEIARYVKILSKDFFRSDYKVNRVEIDDGEFRFNDYSISEKFSIDLKPITLRADSINKSDRRVQLSFKSGIRPYGSGHMTLSINPRDSGDFDLGFHLQDIPIAAFNPYLVTYTSFPLDRGTLELNGTWKVRNSNIQSTNHMVIVDPRVSKRIKNKDMKWMPMPLIMTILREDGNVIDYEIPITGNLKSPKFHFKDIILDVIKNIFVKPPNTPYRMEVRNLESEIERSYRVKWELRQRTLRPVEERFLTRLSAFLRKNKEASISVYPITYAEREKEYILFFETKKKYFLLMRNKDRTTFTREDSLDVEKMSVKDPAMVHFLGKNLSDTVMFTLPEKCINFVGKKIVHERFDQMLSQRDSSFISYFKKNGTSHQVKIHKSVNSIPYDGFSYFKLSYDRDIPRSLAKAYERMIELNQEESRKKYMDYRAKEAPRPEQRKSPEP